MVLRQEEESLSQESSEPLDIPILGEGLSMPALRISTVKEMPIRIAAFAALGAARNLKSLDIDALADDDRSFFPKPIASPIVLAGVALGGSIRTCTAAFVKSFLAFSQINHLRITLKDEVISSNAAFDFAHALQSATGDQLRKLTLSSPTGLPPLFQCRLLQSVRIRIALGTDEHLSDLRVRAQMARAAISRLYLYS